MTLSTEQEPSQEDHEKPVSAAIIEGYKRYLYARYPDLASGPDTDVEDRAHRELSNSTWRQWCEQQEIWDERAVHEHPQLRGWLPWWRRLADFYIEQDPKGSS